MSRLRVWLLLLFSLNLALDATVPQKEHEYLSKNGRYWLRVQDGAPPGVGVPKPLIAQFGQFQWRILHSQRASFPLLNADRPWKFLIADRGDYIVSLTHLVHRPQAWIPAVAIFRSDGTLVRALALSDLFTEPDIEVLMEQFAEIVYDSVVRQEWVLDGVLDESKGWLVLRAAQQGNGLPKVEIPIDLATGTLISPKEDRLWHRRLSYKASLLPVTAEVGDLPSLAMERPLPVYPPLARMAKIRGTVAVELVVEPGGIVVHAKARSGPVQLHGAAEAAARLWRFQAVPPSGERFLTGVIAFRFAWEEVRR